MSEIQRRNKVIAMFMKYGGMSYATAAQFYYELRNLQK